MIKDSIKKNLDISLDLGLLRDENYVEITHYLKSIDTIKSELNILDQQYREMKKWDKLRYAPNLMTKETAEKKYEGAKTTYEANYDNREHNIDDLESAYKGLVAYLFDENLITPEEVERGENTTQSIIADYYNSEEYDIDSMIKVDDIQQILEDNSEPINVEKGDNIGEIKDIQEASNQFIELVYPYATHKYMYSRDEGDKALVFKSALDKILHLSNRHDNPSKNEKGNRYNFPVARIFLEAWRQYLADKNPFGLITFIKEHSLLTESECRIFRMNI